jgi:hypothetical protein
MGTLIKLRSEDFSSNPSVSLNHNSGNASRYYNERKNRNGYARPYSLDRKSATAWENSLGFSTNGKWVASGIMRIFPSGL